MRSWLLAAACAAASVVTGCSHVHVPLASPSVYAVHPEVVAFHARGVELRIDVDVYNPLPSPLATPHYRYALDVEGRTLANGRSGVADLPPAGIGTVSIPVVLPWRDVAACTGGLDGRADVAFDLSGAVTLPVFGDEVELPFVHAGTLPVVLAPVCRAVGTAAVGGREPDAPGAVIVEIENPNGFDLDVAPLAFALVVGDRAHDGLRPEQGAAVVGARSTRTLRLVGGAAAATPVVTQAAGVRVRTTGVLDTPHGPLYLGD